jgi:ComF family protein
LMDDVHLSATSWRSRVKHLTDSLISVLLPPVCANCGKAGTILCADCIALMPRFLGPLCPRCGRIINQSVSLCHACTSGRFPMKQLRATFHFTDPVPGIIHQMKYYGQFALAEPLAALMTDSWPDWQTTFSLIMPIPLHPARERARGYNQSELLARHLSNKLFLSYDPDALSRIRNTRPQVDLNGTERVNNVAGAFRADSDRVEGEVILLVDDVCTTGNTLSEAAKALLAAGSKSVSGYCLARAT